MSAGKAKVKPIYGWRSAVVESELEAPAKLVLLCLSLYMNERTTSAFPSISTLERDTSLGRRTVFKHVRAAVEAGWLTIERGGPTRSNVYHATIPGGARRALGVVPEVHGGSARNSTRVVHDVHPNSPLNSPSNSARASDIDAGSFFAPGSGHLRDHHAGDRPTHPVPDAWREISDFDVTEELGA